MTGFKALAIGGLIVVATAVGAAAQATWSTYVDSRYGTRIAYPRDVFTDVSLGEEGAIFEGAGGRLQVSAVSRDVAGPAELRARMARTAGYEDVTYSPEGRDWLVVSGYRGGMVFYEKYFVTDGTVQGFVLEYPENERQLFDPIVEEIEDSFAAGHDFAAAGPAPQGGAAERSLGEHVDSARGDRRRQARQAERAQDRADRRRGFAPVVPRWSPDDYVPCESDLRCLRAPRG